LVDDVGFRLVTVFSYLVPIAHESIKSSSVFPANIVLLLLLLLVFGLFLQFRPCLFGGPIFIPDGAAFQLALMPDPAPPCPSSLAPSMGRVAYLSSPSRRLSPLAVEAYYRALRSFDQVAGVSMAVS
jgi:hypothetical protein